MYKNSTKLFIAFCTSLLAIVAGLYFNELSVFVNTGYYFILFAFLLWLLSLCRIFPSDLFRKSNIVNCMIIHRVAFIFPFFVILLATSISSPELKILSDEANLINTSHTMYKHNQVYMLMENVFRDFGFSENVVFSLDKRGLFFPFLLSIVHTFIGYSPSNGFIVNILAGYSLLVLFYFFLLRWFSKDSAIFGMVLLAAYPIIIIYTLSSGFEILNVLFVVISLYLFDVYLTKNDWRYAEALLLSLVLLAQIRYESALFSLIIIPILFFELRKQPSYNFSFLTYITPILFLPVLWQRLLTTDYQLPENYNQIFGLDNLIANFPQWWTFFSGADERFGVIGIVFYLSIAGLFMIIYKMTITNNAMSNRVKNFSIAMLFSYGSVALIIMLFWSGNLVDAFVSRLSIVFIPLIIFFAIFFIENVPEIMKPAKKLIPYFGLLLFILYWPEVGKNTAIKSTEGYQRYHLVTKFIKTNYPDKVITVIDPYTTWYNIHTYGAISYNVANLNPESMIGRLKDNTLDELLAIQNISFQTGEVINGKLNDQYKLEELYVRRFRDDTSVRISRVLID
jgi:dolichyl-phosphate-mannose-protein mannosyltransferase